MLCLVFMGLDVQLKYLRFSNYPSFFCRLHLPIFELRNLDRKSMAFQDMKPRTPNASIPIPLNS